MVSVENLFASCFKKKKINMCRSIHQNIVLLIMCKLHRRYRNVIEVWKDVANDFYPNDSLNYDVESEIKKNS
jgi:hypothetical protein